ncbi:MAG: GGDEF domain-containing protein [Pseudomonadota bacterium]|nr:GGDEF domain-containing protein [Pseudomonadota bacterium]
MIKIKDTPAKSREIYAKISTLFSEADINPTPMNYLVWYHYFVGENIPLVDEINNLKGGAKSFTDRLGFRLYEQLIEEPESEAEKEYDFAVRKFVDGIFHKMNHFSTKIEDQSTQIGTYAQGLKNPHINASELEKIAEYITTAAAKMQTSTNEIRDEVQNSSDEVSQLKKQLDEARAEALTDDLTQIGNRKAFNSTIQDLTIEHSTSTEPLCLIMTDIDHFKSFNDTYGHPVGDSVLRYFANIMRADAKDNETVCRYGGEEFAIILKNSSIENAVERAEQIRTQLQAARLTLKGSSEPIKTITASFGVAQFKNTDDELEEFINRADKSLYAAKEAGRNTVMHEGIATVN